MEEFWQKVLYHREYGIDDPPPKKTRKKKEELPKTCEIATDPDDDYSEY
jgi:hypothetical protein